MPQLPNLASASVDSEPADSSADPLGPIPERLRRVAGLLEVALELDPALRAAYLDNLAHQDPALFEQVASFLDGERPSTPAFATSDSDEPETDDRDSTVVGGGPHQGTSEDPDRIGPYRVVGVLGSGGMGYVFRARRVDGEVEREVAIKVLGDGFRAPLAHQRFLSERQILAQLDHPNIAKMYDAGTTAEGRSFLVMELIEAGEVEDPLARARLLETVGRAYRSASEHSMAIESFRAARSDLGDSDRVRMERWLYLEGQSSRGLVSSQPPREYLVKPRVGCPMVRWT